MAVYWRYLRRRSVMALPGGDVTAVFLMASAHDDRRLPDSPSIFAMSMMLCVDAPAARRADWRLMGSMPPRRPLWLPGHTRCLSFLGADGSWGFTPADYGGAALLPGRVRATTIRHRRREARRDAARRLRVEVSRDISPDGVDAPLTLLYAMGQAVLI